MKMRNRFLGLLLIIATVLLQSCKEDPRILTKDYLRYLKKENIEDAKSMHCTNFEDLEITTIDWFKIKESEKKEEYSYRAGRYLKSVDFDVLIKTKKYPNEEIRMGIEVWDTEDYFQSFVDRVDHNHKMYSRNPETRKEGERIYRSRLPDRDKFSDKKQCLDVFVFSEFF